MLSLLFRLIFPVVLLFVSVSARAEKTDIVYLNNGDRITGEVKDLSRGKLQFKTDHMGTVYIEWEDIREIVSDTGQAVELTNGQRFYGPLTKPWGQDMVVVKTAQGAVGVPNEQIVAMYPVAAGFWDRLDISARVGFSWDKGSQVGRYSFGLEAVGMLSYEYYQYNSPERKFSARLLVFPSLTDLGRWRTTFTMDY